MHYIYDMKFRVLLMVLGFLVITLRPVGYVNAYDNETEISCYVDHFDCEVVTVNILNPHLQYAEKVNAYDGFKKSIVGEARPPTIEISKVYINWPDIGKRLERQKLKETFYRQPRDGLNRHV